MSEAEAMKTATIEELTELPVTEWETLRDLFQADWPKHALAFNTLHNYDLLIKKNATMNVKIWTLSGNYKEGTFLLQAGSQLFIYTLEESGDQLQRALSLFNWSKGPRLSPYDDKHRESVMKIMRELSIEFEYDVSTKMFWMSKDKAAELSLKVPDDVNIGPLKPEHAEIANALWPHIFDGSNMFLRELIERNPSRGVYGVEDHQLRAWAIRLDNGMLAALHTHPTHLRKGYGSLVLTAMAKANAEQGSDTIACVIGSNPPTLGLLAKVGFQEIGPVSFAKVRPV